LDVVNVPPMKDFKRIELKIKCIWSDNMNLLKNVNLFLKQRKFERPTVEEALHQQLLFVDFNVGCIKNHHAYKLPNQHIAFHSTELENDIEKYHSEYKIVKATCNKKIRDHQERVLLNGEFSYSCDELIDQINELDRPRKEYYQKAQGELIRKYYDKITNFGLGFYHLYR